tara:strand:+ start:1909 stop:2895 length:987 start_codon:yes stop_codon:yes gene_type:complete
MKFWPIVLVTILITACSTSSKKSETEMSVGGSMPQWVNDPFEFCGSDYLCAVGEGTTMMSAESESRKNLAKIFKVRVSGQTDISQSTSSISNPDSIESAGVYQEMQSHSREVVDEVLEGVITSKKHQAADAYFALAQLPKRTSSKLVKSRIEKLSSEIEIAYNSDRRSMLPKAFELEQKRAELESFLTILGIPNFDRSVTRAQLLAKKAEYDVDPRFVLIDHQGKWDAMAKTVIGELTSLGYKVVRKGPYHFKITIESQSRREYLNVKGFERFHVNAKLTSLDKQGQVVGAMAFERTENGRSLSQIKSQILESFRDQFVNNVSLLQLD